MPKVSSNGINLYYEIAGTGFPILLIGGLGIDITQEVEIVRRLTVSRMVVAFDNRGSGRTDKPDMPYSIRMMAEDVAGLMTGLGIDKADVLGISMGGRIALELSLLHPLSVRKLVLVSTSARADFRRGIVWTLSNLMLRIPAVRAVGTRYPQPYYAYVRQRDASKGYDTTKRLKEIRCPTLIVHGTKDRVVPLELAEEMQSGIAGSELVTFDGGHISSIRGGFVPAVEAFLGLPSSG